MYRVCMVLEKVWVRYNMGLGTGYGRNIKWVCFGIGRGKKMIDGKKE